MREGTLTDEASDELLLLYGCADAALEVAFVEHDSRREYGLGLCDLCNDITTLRSLLPVVLVLSLSNVEYVRIVIETLAFPRRLELSDVNATTSSARPSHQPSHGHRHKHGQVKNTLESLLRHRLQALHIIRSTATTMGLHELLAPTDQALQHLPPAAAKAVLTARR
jgi:hypothetical protein